MEDESQGEDWMPAFFVGHHETNRKLPVTGQMLEQALNCNVKNYRALIGLTDEP